LETICAKLERDPLARYRSTGQLADDLDAGCLGVRLSQGPVATCASWVRRNPLVAQMAALLLVMATAVGVMISKAQTVSPFTASGIAVLPFESLSPDNESAFFAYGVYDGVWSKLAKLANLKVINHNSVAKYRGAHNTQEIGRALNAAYTTGNVQRQGASIRLNASD
jgi:hypothetical protein